MDVRFGVIFATKELTLEMDGSAEEVEEAVKQAINEAESIAWFTDKRGTRLAVPVDKLSYVEIEGTNDSRHVGFGSG